MAGQRVAVVGVGQTVHRTARKDVSMAGLVREAAQEALDDAGMTWSDIDAVVIGKAPDMFEGVAMPELYLADALGAVGKPMMRVHTAGSVGGSTSIVAAKLVAAGLHERVLTVAYEKQSESNATWGLSVPMPFAAPVGWVHGMAMRSEPTMFARRDQVNPQAGKDCAKDVYTQAGIVDPRRDFDCAEVYVPFSWYEPMWLENLGFCAEGDGWKLTEEGATAPNGDIPWN